MGSSKKNQYYYANNEQVSLESVDDYVAFDLDDIEQPSRKFMAFVEKSAEQMRKSVYLVSRDDLTDEAEKIIDKNNAWRPVFRSGDTLLVILPEVRIEDSSTDDLEAKVKAWVEKNKSTVQFKSGKRSHVVVEPVANSGHDALSIANSLHEDLKIASAEPRMIQRIKAPRPTSN